jgi:hypothetical protein
MKSPGRAGARRGGREKRAADQAAGPGPAWRPHVSLYADQRVLTFASDADLGSAIDLLWSEELRTLPHETPDGCSLVVPAEAVVYFSNAGLRFTEKRLRGIGDLPVGEIKRLRR